MDYVVWVQLITKIPFESYVGMKGIFKKVSFSVPSKLVCLLSLWDCPDFINFKSEKMPQKQWFFFNFLFSFQLKYINSLNFLKYILMQSFWHKIESLSQENYCARANSPTKFFYFEKLQNLVFFLFLKYFHLENVRFQ